MLKHMSARSVAITILARLPGRLRAAVLWWLFGFNVHPSARIGLCYLDVENLRMEASSRIGHLTVCTDLASLELEEGATIGRLNLISGFPHGYGLGRGVFGKRDPSLYVGGQSAITNRHAIDCTDSVRIGEFATVAGYHSQFITHSLDSKANHASCAPIVIGSFTFVGSRSVLEPGSRLPDRSVLGAGSVLRTSEARTDRLYSGVPAIPISEIGAGAYFGRAVGRVH